jgi:ribosomal-protein-alanine N-acetyltransferase
VEVRLRPYEPADFDALYEIDQACYPPGIAYSKRTLRWFLRLPGAHTLVALDGAKPIGFILSEYEGPRAHIITLDVLEPYRRQHVGTDLLIAQEAWLAGQGVRRIVLETATDNLAAIAFWQKHGYRTCGVLKRYYLGRVDAYYMEKTLSASM